MDAVDLFLAYCAVLVVAGFTLAVFALMRVCQ